MTKTATKKTEKAEQKTTLTPEHQIFAMWRKRSKKGDTYFTGAYHGNDEHYAKDLRGFYNSKKKNPNEPDVKIYLVNEDGELLEEPIVSLWCNATDSGKKYLSGKYKEKRVVGFINDKATKENKQPYFSVYYSDDKKADNEKRELTEIKEDNKLPF